MIREKSSATHGPVDIIIRSLEVGPYVEGYYEQEFVGSGADRKVGLPDMANA